MTPRDVLVVDDTEDCRVILRSMLKCHGHRVRTADSGKEALAAVEAQAPDVILLDMMMAGMSGLEVLERLRACPATARIPVILVTARSGDDDVMDGYQQGADYYITKPCTARQVMHGIALVLGEADAASNAA
jgi:two-component system phosphate regulon response regulator PhoB